MPMPMPIPGYHHSCMLPLLRNAVFVVAAVTYHPGSSVAAESLPLPTCYEAYERDDYARVVTECMTLAIRGDAQAQLYLGMAYAHGRGVTADPMFAYMWLDIAVSHGMSGWSDAIRMRARVAEWLTDSQIRIASFLAREYWSDVRRWLAVVTAHASGGPLMPGTQVSWPDCEFRVNFLQEPRWTKESTPFGDLPVARAQGEDAAISAGCGPLSGELRRLCDAYDERGTAAAGEARRSLVDYLRHHTSVAFGVEVTSVRVSDSVLGVQTQIDGQKPIVAGSYRFTARFVCGQGSVAYIAVLEPLYGPQSPEGLIVLESLARR